MSVPGAEREHGKGFHELPLVLFTALAVAGAGLMGARLVYSSFSWLPWLPARSSMVISVVCLVLGLGVSTLHLGRPFRGYRALARVVRSPLSNEVVALGAAVVLTSAAALIPRDHGLSVLLAVAAMVSCLLALLALGMVYQLPNQLTWFGPSVLQPLVLGLGLGLTLLLEALGGGARARGELIVLLVYSADGLLVWERTRRLATSLAQGVPVHPRLMRHRSMGLSLRVLTGLLIPAVAILGGSPSLAGVGLVVNLILDRVLFYGLAVVSNTEAEIMKVEMALRARSGMAGEGRGSPRLPPSAHEW